MQSVETRYTQNDFTAKLDNVKLPLKKLSKCIKPKQEIESSCFGRLLFFHLYHILKVNKCSRWWKYVFSVVPRWQLSWFAGSLPHHNSRGWVYACAFAHIVCRHITCVAFMLQHWFLQGHVQLKCETSDSDTAQHVSVSSFRPCRSRCTHSFCLWLIPELFLHKGQTIKHLRLFFLVIKPTTTTSY